MAFSDSEKQAVKVAVMKVFHSHNTRPVHMMKDPTQQMEPAVR